MHKQCPQLAGKCRSKAVYCAIVEYDDIGFLKGHQNCFILLKWNDFQRGGLKLQFFPFGIEVDAAECRKVSGDKNTDCHRLRIPS